MAAIVSNENSLVLNGRHSISRTGIGVKISGEFVHVYSSCGKVDWKVDYKKDTVDEESFANVEDLFDALRSFNNGGGDGDGVTWDQVTDKPLYTLGTPIQDSEGLVPVYTQNGQLPVGMPEFPDNAVPLILLDVRAPELEEGNFLVGGKDGNDQRRIVGPDLGVTQTSNNWYLVRWNPVEQEWGGTAQLVSPSPNTSAIRTSSGQGKFSPAINGDEAVVLGQFSGIVNDTLTDSETSSSLDALYPNVISGTVVTTQTGLTEYRKVEPGVWSKKTIEIV